MEELETEMIRGGRALHQELSILDVFSPSVLLLITKVIHV